MTYPERLPGEVYGAIPALKLQCANPHNTLHPELIRRIELLIDAVLGLSSGKYATPETLDGQRLPADDVWLNQLKPTAYNMVGMTRRWYFGNVYVLQRSYSDYSLWIDRAGCDEPGEPGQRDWHVAANPTRQQVRGLIDVCGQYGIYTVQPHDG